ncbi:MAG: sulfate ABC transporter substrate-binding protein [Pseudanabaenaceae cyanobacterium]
MSRSQARGGRWFLWPWRGWLVLGLSLALGLSACTGSGGTNLILSSFVAVRTAHNAIIPKFQVQWQQDPGQNINFQQSYGSSGAQTRAVLDGLRADVVHLSLGLDTNRLAQAGLVDANWAEKFPNRSIVSQSVVALIVREGNPKNIQTWADLQRPDVQVITANPKSSGVARWIVLALWHAASQSGANETQARAFLTAVFRNVPIWPRDAREATDIFAKGQGDVLLNYENEVLLALANGQKLDYIVPPVNLDITHPIALVDRNVDRHGNRQAAAAFVNFLYTPVAQREFAKAGFRPVDATVAQEAEFVRKFPPISNLGTVEDYGGWEAVQKKFFADGALFDQIQAQLRG